MTWPTASWPCERLALGFEIDAAGEAFELAAAGVGRREAARPATARSPVGAAGFRRFGGRVDRRERVGASARTGGREFAEIGGRRPAAGNRVRSTLRRSAARRQDGPGPERPTTALSAAITSKAERNGCNIETDICAVNRPVGRPDASNASPRRGDPPSAWHLLRLNCPDGDAPRSVVGTVFPDRFRGGQPDRGRFSDESFRRPGYPVQLAINPGRIAAAFAIQSEIASDPRLPPDRPAASA